MTIKEIAAKLNDCANVRCKECKYMYVDDPAECQNYMMKDMADEIRSIVAREEDDRR